ncbi:MAG: M43 family zinc metalloprotease, partial [Bacteroidota bacterium]
MTELRPTLTLWMILGLMMPFFLAAQNLERCSYGEKMEQAFALDPAYKKAVLTEDWSATPAYQNKSSQSIITIPVHVIIVHPPGQAVGAGVNFSLAHVESQIQVLTDDFRRMNADAINTPTVFPAGDSEIEFCLATVDPNGNPTDGITRYATNQNLNSDELAIKTATGWDRNTYLNFWVGPNLGSLLGWAYLPTTTTLPDPTLDGIVVVSCSFGGPGFGTCAPYDLGRTGTHEVGHYLGLRHVWGAGGCSSDDGIADTPIQSGANFGCPNHPSPTCNNGGDMFMNYMDYVHDDCMNAFTVGQGTRMNNILNTSRSSLLGAAGIVCNSAVPLTLNLLNQTNVSCFAGNDGSISVEAIGGSGAYTYSINGGTPQNSGVFLNLTAGTYTVAVNDGSSSLAIQVTITAPAQLVPFVVNQTPTTCAGNGDGTLILGASGGTNLSGQGYQFNFNGNGFSSNNVFTNLSGGLYTVEVKDDNDCTESLQVIINEPNPLVSFLVNQVAIDCAGNNNGSVEVQSTGGTPIYSYALNGSGFDPNPVFSNLTAGSYFLQTVDASGCENTLNFTMTEPDTLMVALVSQVNLACFGDTNGSVEVSVTGGVGNFEFSLGNATNTTGIFENLSAGNYMLTATDANGCEDNMTFTILSPPEIFLEMIEMENVTCAGIANGSVEIQATGGVGNFEFSLGNATNTTGIFENLSAGNYTLTATDANGCQDNMAFTISSPAEISLEMLEMENVTCAGIANGSVE